LTRNFVGLYMTSSFSFYDTFVLQIDLCFIWEFGENKREDFGASKYKGK